MAWLEITSEISATIVDACSEILENLGAVSVSFLDAGEIPLLEPLPGTTPIWDKVKIVGLFPQEIDLNALNQSLLSLLPQLTFTATPLAEQDWTRTWLEHFRPMKFGQHLWVAPCDHPIPEEQQDDAVVVKLDPGLAFGTGTHATTALCLEWLDANPPLAQTVIDYGCGSGILGIAALMLGAEKVWGVDYDPQALLATNENGHRNQLPQDRLIAIKPTDLPSIQAHTVLANILAEPLITLAPLLSEHCAPGGNLVLSGLLSNQAEAVQAAYTPWFSFEETVIKENWVLLAGKKLNT